MATARYPYPSPLPGESSEARLERKVDHITTAVFGNELDRDDHGLLGDMRDLRHVMTERLDKLLAGVLTLAATLIVVAVTIALSVH